MARLLTAADIDKTDPRKLAEVLRTKCNYTLQSGNGAREHFAAALLAVLDNLLPWQTHDGVLVEAAARAWLAAGGTLEVKDEPA